MWPDAGKLVSTRLILGENVATPKGRHIAAPLFSRGFYPRFIYLRFLPAVFSYSAPKGRHIVAQAKRSAALGKEHPPTKQTDLIFQIQDV